MMGEKQWQPVLLNLQGCTFEKEDKEAKGCSNVTSHGLWRGLFGVVMVLPQSLVSGRD